MAAILFGLLLLPPLAAAALALALAPGRRGVGLATGALAPLPVAAALGLGGQVLAGAVPVWGPGDLLRADALSALMAACVSVVAALAAWLGPGGGEEATPAEARRFRVFTSLFAFTMLVAVTAHSVGFMWVAIEATTITSAVLIPLRLRTASVEASWKYLLLGSVGIALAFAGTVLAYVDFVNLAGRQETALHWTVLRAAAPRLHPEILELAFVFLLVGYGTKAGLAPMHTWLPDAHAEAPAAVSAMMSGVLLAVALYALARWKAVVDLAAGRGFTDGLLLWLGMLSLAVAALSLVAQRNYKRLLAYSSIEHTGLACIGLALGPAGAFAALLHVANHALSKAPAFLLAGRVLGRYGSTSTEEAAGLLRVMPWTGRLFAAALLALLGLPPSGLFVSEYLLFRAGFQAGRPWVMGLALALVGVAFVAVLAQLHRMLHGRPGREVAPGERPGWAHLPLAAALGVVVALGLVLPEPVARLVARAAAVIQP